MRVTLISRSAQYYGTRRLMEAGAALGLTMARLDPVRVVIHGGQKAPVISEDGAPWPQPEVVVPRFGKRDMDWGLALLDVWIRAGARCPTSPAAIALAQDKLRCHLALAGAGLPVLPLAAVRQWLHIDDALASVGGAPVVIKLRRGTGGRGVALAPDAASARSALDALIQAGQTLLIEPFIHNRPPRDVRVLVAGGEPLAACVREAPDGDFRSNVHVGGQALPFELPLALAELALQAAAAVGLSFAGVDLMETPDGWVVLEVNASPGFEGIEAATGRDLVTPFLERFIGTD